MICMLLSNEAMLKKDIVDAAKSKASKGRLGRVNIRHNPPPLEGKGQLRFVLNARTFYQKMGLCQLTLRKRSVNVSLTTSYSAIAFSHMAFAVTDPLILKAQKGSNVWLCKCPLLSTKYSNAPTPEEIVL